MNVPVVKMLDPDKNECFVNASEVAEWVAKGYTVPAPAKAKKTSADKDDVSE